MSTIDQTDQLAVRGPAEVDLPGSPRAHRWTVYEYQQLSELGLLGERKTELADGVIVEMSSQKDPHRISVSRVARAMMGVFDESYLVTIQSTVRLSLHESREPDACVETPPKNPGENALVHPLLVVEVSDETLLYDQVVKASLYAAHAVQDYWIVNLKELQIEVHRQPVQDPARRYGWRFSQLTIHRPPDSVSPLVKPDARIAVASMLP